MSTPIFIGSRQTDNLIASFPCHCLTCNEQTTHVYGEISKKLTLNFIPVQTLERWPFIQCATCGLARRIPPDQTEKFRALAESGAAPFRPCLECGAHNDPQTILCRVCDEVLRPTLFLRKGAARALAIVSSW